MGIREVLQTEIWSKQTTLKILKAFGICFLLVFEIVVTGSAIELLWISPPERKAAKIALSKIDDLQQANNVSEDEYKKRKDKAETATDAALKASWTIRDQRIANALYAYFSMTDMQRLEPRIRAAMEENHRKHPELPPLKTEPQDMSPQILEFLRTTLHHALD